MFSHWVYILIGNDNTGKTSFQRYLLWHLCGQRYTRLQRNIVQSISHPRAPKGLSTIFTCNRSFQEKRSEYKSVENYFRHFFQEEDIGILSSHTHESKNEVAQMIRELRRRCYNVAGVFWSNAFDDDAREIALLTWDEVLWVENPQLTDKQEIKAQLDQIAEHFSEFLIARASIQ